MNFKRAFMLGFILVLIAFGFAAWMYPHLPNLVPTHWDTAGKINGYTPKPWGVFISPLTMLGVWVVLLVLPRISPRGYRLDQFRGVYGTIQLAILGVSLVISVATLSAAAGRHVDIARLTSIAVGLLLIILGNYMGKIRKNFFIGIRTPWTLASDEVWSRTHRFGGWLFVIAGLCFIIESLLNLNTMVSLVTLLTAAILSVIYSYVIYKRLEGFPP